MRIRTFRQYVSIQELKDRAHLRSKPYKKYLGFLGGVWLLHFVVLHAFSTYLSVPFLESIYSWMLAVIMLTPFVLLFGYKCKAAFDVIGVGYAFFVIIACVCQFYVAASSSTPTDPAFRTVIMVMSVTWAGFYLGLVIHYMRRCNLVTQRYAPLYFVRTHSNDNITVTQSRIVPRSTDNPACSYIQSGNQRAFVMKLPNKKIALIPCRGNMRETRV